ncbi:MAG: ATP phosphoribosyltransferase regulatory subunit [Clostridia bacterium]|nr:ATP phosphoribosyltransferase regulatory subunit [Clostridia bacterium]
MDVFKSFTEEERIYFSLKGLYEGFGYRQYRMRKFEEYSLYSENKNFLMSSDIITFSGRDGKLLALKPDVTLSIVKNTQAGTGRKLYYRESVYRTDGSGSFKEISQIGLEYLGDIDGYSQLEVLSLAAESLKAVGGGYVIDLSHMGVIEGVLSECGLTSCPDAVAQCIKARNVHDLAAVCLGCGIEEGVAKRLAKLLDTKGKYMVQLDALRSLFPNKKCLAAADELEALINGLKASGTGGSFRVEFSVLNDAMYYNGVIFHGYLEKFPRVVLSGGRYDNLVKKLSPLSGGMGFALYPDELGYYYDNQPQYDADILLLYTNDVPPEKVLQKAKELIGGGYTVRVAQSVPQGMRFGKIIKI